MTVIFVKYVQPARGAPVTRLIPVELKLSDTVSDLKRVLSWRHGFPREAQHLEVGLQRLLKECKTLKDYGIDATSTVRLRVRLEFAEVGDARKSEITICMLSTYRSTMCVHLKVWGSDTIQAVKEMIRKSALGVPPHQQCLIYGGRTLIHDERTLKECHVRPLTTLYLSRVQALRRRRRSAGELMTSRAGSQKSAVDAAMADSKPTPVPPVPREE